MRRTLLLSAALLSISGCQETRDFQISGRVTLNGRPLPDATIEFTPDEGASLRVETSHDGTYQVVGELDSSAAATAMYQVSVTTGGEMLRESGESVVVVERVPERYNVQSELEMEVHIGSNRRDWRLATGKKTGSR